MTAQSLPEWGKQEGAENNNNKTPKTTTKTWKGREIWEPSWGERLTSTRNPAIYILDVTTGMVEKLQKLPEDHSCGQPIWEPKDNGIVFVGWPHIQSNFNDTSVKLGFIYCRNRPCSLFHVSTDGHSEAVCLTSHLPSAFIQGFAPNGHILVFYSATHAVTTGIHDSSVRVYTMGWDKALDIIKDGKTDFSAVTTLIVDDLKAPRPPLNFPGFYVDVLEPMANHFIGHPIPGMGEIQTWNPIGMKLESYTLLCHVDGVLVALRSSLTSAPTLVMRRMHVDDEWIALNDELQPQVEPSAAAILDQIEQVEILFPPKNYPSGKPVDPPPVDCPGVLIRNKNKTGLFVVHAVVQCYSGPQPTLLAVHGGPHSTAFQTYSPALLAYLSLGISVLTVNFRGSIGYGTDFTMALPGNIGTVDVEDCMEAVQLAIKEGYTDPTRLAVSGGSHGGFLTGHLVGQYPEVFKCAILRNPVLTIGHMIYTTDIPDWVFVEVFGPKGQELFSTMPKADALAAMHEKSPAAYIDRVQTPLLFMLGAMDVRVPPSDSLRYIQTLKSRKGHPEVHVVLFPEDSHPLDKPQTEFENIMNILWWLRKHGIAE